MKKLFILIGLISSMYAVPPCENINQEVCIYYWRGGGYTSEIRIANVSKNKVIIENAWATLDYISGSVSNRELESGQDIVIGTIKYEDPSKEKKGVFRIFSFKYKVIEEQKKNIQPQTSSTNNQEKKIQIQMK